MKYISKSLIINLPLLPTKDLTMKCNEEEKSLSSEAFSRVSLTNLRRSAVPDLSSDLGMNIFKKVSRTIYVLCILVIKKKYTVGHEVLLIMLQSWVGWGRTSERRSTPNYSTGWQHDLGQHDLGKSLLVHEYFPFYMSCGVVTEFNPDDVCKVLLVVWLWTWL